MLPPSLLEGQVVRLEALGPGHLEPEANERLAARLAGQRAAP